MSCCTKNYHDDNKHADDCAERPRKPSDYSSITAGMSMAAIQKSSDAAHEVVKEAMIRAAKIPFKRYTGPVDETVKGTVPKMKGKRASLIIIDDPIKNDVPILGDSWFASVKAGDLDENGNVITQEAIDASIAHLKQLNADGEVALTFVDAPIDSELVQKFKEEWGKISKDLPNEWKTPVIPKTVHYSAHVVGHMDYVAAACGYTFKRRELMVSKQLSATTNMVEVTCIGCLQAKVEESKQALTSVLQEKTISHVASLKDGDMFFMRVPRTTTHSEVERLRDTIVSHLALVGVKATVKVLACDDFGFAIARPEGGDE